MRKWKNFFFQIQCQIYRKDPRQILYNFDFFVQELNFFSIFDELSTEMKNMKNSKCRVRHWKNLFSPEVNVKNIEISATLIFSSRNFNFLKFSMNCPQRWNKWLSPGKNFVMGKKFRFRDFRFKTCYKTFWIDSDQKNFRLKIFDFAFFSPFLAKKWSFLKILGPRNFFFKKNFAIVLRIIFPKFWAIEHSCTLPVEASSSNELPAPLAAAAYQSPFIESGARTKKWQSQEKIYTRNFFRFWDFRFKIHFETFWIDSDQKILTLPFFHHFWLKKFKKKCLSFLKSTSLQKLWAIIGLSSLSDISRLTRSSAFFVDQKWRFLDIFNQKVSFSKNWFIV